MMLVACGMLAISSCSEFDDYNTAPGDMNPAADKTLWENISSNPSLSDFASVAKQVGYDAVLNASHTYTVWAPVNGSFDVDSLKKVSKDRIIKEFLHNHMADFSHKENDSKDTIIYMLNEKLLKFTGKNSSALAFDSQSILPNTDVSGTFNRPCTNGILYVLSAPTKFRYNAYEYLTEAKSIASKFFAFVNRYERVTLDEGASVKGQIINGVQHYDDSVVIISNTLTERTMNADLNNEDSAYTILIPTDEAWDEAYNERSVYYNYLPSLNWQDLSHTDVGANKGGNKTSISLLATKGKKTSELNVPPVDAEITETAPYWTDSITKSFISRNLIFSENEKKYNTKLPLVAPFAERDTLLSTTRGYLVDLMDVDASTLDVVKLSNGHARIINTLPAYKGDTIITRSVARMVATGGRVLNEFIPKMDIDSAICVLKPEDTGLRYVKVDLPTGSNFAPELDFYLPNVLSTTYDVKLVVVPACVEDTTMAVEDMKPYALIVDINYTDASNKQIAARFAGEGKPLMTSSAELKKTKAFIVGQYKVDTLNLGRVTFPVCYRGTGAQPNIKVMNFENLFSASVKKKYEQMMRIANIILEPVMTLKENENGSKE